MGFKPIETREVGLYGDAAWVDAPKRVSRAPLPKLPPLPPAPPPRPLVEDFESTPTGRQPDMFSITPANRPELVRVTDEVAAGGKKCLKFTDAAGLQHSWEPHLCYSSKRYLGALVRFSCDIQNCTEHPSDGYLGLRDWGSAGGQYREGPSLTWKADGTLLAGTKPIAQLPPGRWCHFAIEIRQDVSDQATKRPQTYRLQLTLAGEPPKTFELPLADRQFRQFTWFGFSATGAPGSVFYVDNIRLEQAP
jgi:hypothetical protein